MIDTLPRVQRRILALVLLLLLLAVAVRALIVPLWITFVDNRDAIAQAEDSIVRYSRLSARVDALRTAVSELQESDDLDRFVLAQDSEPIAAAALQERVKAAVTESGGSLTSTQVLSAQAEQGFKRITVNVRMAVSMEALQRVLYELESNIPYLLADDITILSRGGVKRRRANRPAVDLLDVRFNLYGFMRDAGGGV